MKKVFKYIALGLLVAFALYVLLSFILNKDGTMYWINQVIDWLNKPLPIVGITTLALLVFVWKCFIASKFGKKAINELKQENAKLREENEKFKQETNNKLNEFEEKQGKAKEQLISLCELSTNQKIKNFGKELENYGKENVDC